MECFQIDEGQHVYCRHEATANVPASRGPRMLDPLLHARRQESNMRHYEL